MASDEALELLEEKCDSHRQNAQRCVESSPRQAVYHFSKAADLHDRLADEIDSDPVGTAHRSQAETMRSNAHRLMQKLDLVPDDRSSDEHRERKRESKAAMSTKDSEFFESPPDFDLSDVGGMDGLKQRLLSEVRRPLENPEFYEKQGAGIENGVLLHGPPGTGKTHVAKCFAGELGYPFAKIHANDIESKWVGEAPKNVEELFQDARSCEPCVLFIDEIDALATDRSTGPQSTKSQRQVVNKLLDAMQSVQDSEVLVIAATNRPEDLDGAITRSRRFNQKFRVSPPDADARKEILKVQLDDGRREVDWDSINWSKLVDWSQGFSAADLALVVERAARMSADESTDRGELVAVQYRHLLQMVKETEASLKYWNDRGT